MMYAFFRKRWFKIVITATGSASAAFCAWLVHDLNPSDARKNIAQVLTAHVSLNGLLFWSLQIGALGYIIWMHRKLAVAIKTGVDSTTIVQRLRIELSASDQAQREIKKKYTDLLSEAEDLKRKIEKIDPGDLGETDALILGKIARGELPEWWDQTHNFVNLNPIEFRFHIDRLTERGLIQIVPERIPFADPTRAVRKLFKLTAAGAKCVIGRGLDKEQKKVDNL